MTASHSILADLNNTIVRIVPTSVRISHSSSPFTNLLALNNIQRLIWHQTQTTKRFLPILWWQYRAHWLQMASPLFSCCIDFLFTSKVQVLIPLFDILPFCPVVWWDVNIHNSTGDLLLLTINRSGRLAEIRWSVCITRSQRILCVSFSRIGFWLCIDHVFAWLYLNFSQNSLWIPFPTQTCLFLYSLCANLLHSLIMWLIVFSLSPHNRHLQFCCVLSILALTYGVVLFSYHEKFSFSLKFSLSSPSLNFLVW